MIKMKRKQKKKTQLNLLNVNLIQFALLFVVVVVREIRSKNML